jgi:hypothetical protein
MVGVMESPHLVRLGLSHAALKAAILTALEEGGVHADAEAIATAVADALDTKTTRSCSASSADCSVSRPKRSWASSAPSPT